MNEKDRLGWTALFYAAEHGEPDAIEILLDAGADVSARSVKGWTARHGYVHIARRLIQAGMEMDTETDRGWTPLKSAGFFWNDPDSARVLLHAGANPPAKDQGGESILQCAVRNSGQEMVDLIEQRCPKAA